MAIAAVWVRFPLPLQSLIIKINDGPVAQLDRATAFKTRSAMARNPIVEAG